MVENNPLVVADDLSIDAAYWQWGTGTQMRDFIHIEDCVSGRIVTYRQIEDRTAVDQNTDFVNSFRRDCHAGWWI